MSRILIVDDDAMNLRVAGMALGVAGHEVLEATDGATACRLAAARRPELVLLDVQMPLEDGIGVLRTLRADPRTRSLKVVALTAQAMKGDAERLLALGFDGYIAKPIRYKELLADVARLLAV